MEQIPPEDLTPQRNISIGGSTFGSTLTTGDNSPIIINRDGESLEAILATFREHSERALRRSRPRISGLRNTVPRTELAQIEEHLQDGRSTLVAGDSGTGKSGLSHELAQRAQERGQPLLVIDSRDLQTVGDEHGLRNHYSLRNCSVATACNRLAVHARSQTSNENLKCLLIIDQIDNVVATTAGIELRELALTCSANPLVDVAVFSRRREMEEDRFLQPLYEAGFVPIPSEELLDATPYLEMLDISNPSDELLQLARNLLNLSLIGAIRQQRAEYDFGSILGDVALWDSYLETLCQSEASMGEALMCELERLAEVALMSEDSSFPINRPLSDEHRRLLSWRLIKRRASGTWIGVFAHENLQDFLYARHAIGYEMSPAQVAERIPYLRVQNVLLWMEKMAETYKIPNRSEVLRSLLNG